MKNLCFKTFILENHLIPITNPFLSNANRINGLWPALYFTLSDPNTNATNI
jgi:hypothetical protein